VNQGASLRARRYTVTVVEFRRYMTPPRNLKR
jgi:hypothetical protein